MKNTNITQRNKKGLFVVYKMKLGIFEDFFMLNPNLAFILGW